MEKQRRGGRSLSYVGGLGGTRRSEQWIGQRRYGTTVPQEIRIEAVLSIAQRHSKTITSL